MGNNSSNNSSKHHVSLPPGSEEAERGGPAPCDLNPHKVSLGGEREEEDLVSWLQVTGLPLLPGRVPVVQPGQPLEETRGAPAGGLRGPGERDQDQGERGRRQGLLPCHEDRV